VDTAKDARVLVLEDALRRLNEIVGNRKMKMHVDYSKLNEILKSAGSLIYEVKYSYVDAKALAEIEPTKTIVKEVASFAEIVNAAISSGYSPTTVKELLVAADLDYSLRVVKGIQQKFREFSDDPAFAIDILAVEISGIQSVPDSKNLSECRCTDGTRIWRVLTNIQELKSGTKLPCAVLPPSEMMGIVSEAMFLSGTALSDSIELGPLSNPPSAALDQARAQVLQITKRMT
jgi:predicted RNA-binding protein with EMAP domain